MRKILLLIIGLLNISFVAAQYNHYGCGMIGNNYYWGAFGLIFSLLVLIGIGLFIFLMAKQFQNPGGKK